jgi:hypothetical protein
MECNLILKKFLLISLCSLAVLLASCVFSLPEKDPVDNTTGAPPASVHYDRKFYAVNFQKEIYYSLYTVKIAENERCIIYADWQAGVTPAQGNTIAEEYKNRIYPKISGVFGEPLDVDENGKLIIVLLDIIDGLANTDSYIAGYFSSGNMYSKNDVPSSNEADMIYMDVKNEQPLSETFYATLAHEFQHLLRFSDTARRLFKGEDVKLTETWLDEGLATAAEYIYLEKHPPVYVSYFNRDPTGKIARGNNFYIWGGSDYDDYVTAYLFFEWLRIQSEGKSDDKYNIYRKICESGYSDYRGVVSAAKELISEDLDSWDKIIGSWLLANYMQTPDKKGALGLYGYNGEFDTLSVHTLSGSTSIELYPGEGVFSVIDGTFSAGNSGSINYIGATKEGEVNKIAPFTQEWLLTFNGNSRIDGSKEIGRLTGVRAPPTPHRAVGETPPFKRRLDGTHIIPVVPGDPLPIAPAN